MVVYFSNIYVTPVPLDRHLNISTYISPLDVEILIVNPYYMLDVGHPLCND